MNPATTWTAPTAQRCWRSSRPDASAWPQLEDVMLPYAPPAGSLAPQRSAIAHLLAVNREAGEAALRTWLAQIGLDAQLAAAPVGSLSGGERLKVALACALYAHPPAQLLLLDEPSNHLDLSSLQALEAMLRQYQGALIVVSHDQVFLQALELTHQLQADASGWHLCSLPNDELK